MDAQQDYILLSRSWVGLPRATPALLLGIVRWLVIVTSWHYTRQKMWVTVTHVLAATTPNNHRTLCLNNTTSQNLGVIRQRRHQEHAF